MTVSQNAAAQAVTSSPVISAVRTVSPDATELGSMFSQSNTSGMSILKSCAASTSHCASSAASSGVTACEKKYSPTRSPAAHAPATFWRKRSSSTMPPLP